MEVVMINVPRSHLFNMAKIQLWYIMTLAEWYRLPAVVVLYR